MTRACIAATLFPSARDRGPGGSPRGGRPAPGRGHRRRPGHGRPDRGRQGRPGRRRVRLQGRCGGSGCGQADPAADRGRQEGRAPAGRPAGGGHQGDRPQGDVGARRTVVEHREEWREGQAPHASTRPTRILAPLDDVERELGLLGQGLGILNTLGRDTVDVDHGLSFKHPVVGARQRRPVDKQLAELRDTIRAALPAPPPTAEEQQREQELRERRQRWQRMASPRGGVHVPGGGQ